MVGLAGFVAVAYFALRVPDPSTVAKPPAPDPVDWLRAVGRIGGSVVAGSLGITEMVGYAVIVLGVALCVVAVRSARGDLAPWIGLFTYALGSAVIVGHSRYLWIIFFGHQSRYASIAATLH